MARSEHQLIDRCKREIEQKFSFGAGQGYTQRDLELLSAHIEEKTGVIISLSTLKRLWRDSYKQGPQLATLNALAMVLDHRDWQHFKHAHRERSNPVMAALKWGVPIAALVVVVSVFVLSASFDSANSKTETKNNKPPLVSGPVHFEAVKTVASGIPSTVIFKYDVSNVVADTFYIQQSWNPDHRMGIDPRGRAMSSIYYESGFHKARLVANDSIIATQPVHIISNGWEPHIYHSNAEPEPVNLKNEKFTMKGILHLDSGMLAKRHLDFSKRFHMRITNSQDFGLHSDNFSFFTRMKTDRLADQLCSWMNILIVTEVNAFAVSWTEKGCETKADYKLGEISRKGSDNDLSALGCDVYEWQELALHVKDRVASITLNGQLVYKETYREDYGKIMALIYRFDGTGSIDYSRLEDGRGRKVFDENFDEHGLAH
jgi:hypothetical protein